MPKPVQPLVFPIKGLHESAGFDVQPPGTTNDARNVRAFCALAGRARGGSRSGTSKYTYGRVTTAGKPIQNMVKAVEGAAYPAAFTTLSEDFQGYTAEVGPLLHPLWMMASILDGSTIEVHPAVWETTANGLVWRKSSQTTGGVFRCHCLPLSSDAEALVSVTLRANSTMATSNAGFGVADEASMVGPFVRASFDLQSGYAAFLRASTTNTAELHIIKLVPGVDDGYEIVATGTVGALAASATITENCVISVETLDESTASLVVKATVVWPGGGSGGSNINTTVTYLDTNPGTVGDQQGSGVGVFNHRSGVVNPTFSEGTAFRTVAAVASRYKTPSTRLVAARWVPTESGLTQYFRPRGTATITHDGLNYVVQPNDGYDSDVVDSDELMADTNTQEYASAFSTGLERNVCLTRPWDAGGPFDLEVVLNIPSTMVVTDVGKLQFWVRVNPDAGQLIRAEIQFVIDHLDCAVNGTGRLSSMSLTSIGSTGVAIYDGGFDIPVPISTGSVLRVEDLGTEMVVFLDGRIVGRFSFPLEVGANPLPEIFASDGGANDDFGQTVDVDNGVLVVGAPSEGTNGVNAGAAYLFNVATGVEITKILPAEVSTSDSFGFSVAVKDGLVVVGAPFDDDEASNAGAVYVFSAVTGAQILKLTASDAAANDQFGFSVGIDNGVIIVGAPKSATPAVGAAYLFNAVTGAELQILTADDGFNGDEFAQDVAISGDVAVVGALDALNSGAVSAGAAYIFKVSDGTQTHKIEALGGVAGDTFGNAVAVSGNVVVVGDRFASPFGSHSGAAYIFQADTGAQVTKITASDATVDSDFGTSVATDGVFVLVGAPGAPNNTHVGAAYLYDAQTGAALLNLTATDGVVGDLLAQSVAIDNDVAVFGAPSDNDLAANAGSVYRFDLFPPTVPPPPDATDTYAGVGQGRGAGVGAYPQFVNYVSDIRWVRPSGSQYDEVGSGTSGRLLATSGGDIVDVTGGLITPIPSGVEALDDGAFTIQSVAAFNSVFFTDGAIIQEYDLSTGVVAQPTAVDGVFPTDPRLLTLYRGRLVWSGTPDDPHNWFMSAAGNPLDYNYSPAVPNEAQAIAGNNSIAGLIGDVITALIPFGDDYMIFGCDSTIWQMTGDPAAGGVIDLVSDQTGMAFGSAWAKDPANTLYFWGNDGVYRLVPGGKPQNMTKNRIDFRLRDVALDQNRILMAWNYLDAELMVLIQPADSTQPVRVLGWESRVDAWWEDEYPAAHGPNTLLAYNSTEANDQAFLLGGRDGFIRKVDRSVGDDDGVLMPSHVRFAPFLSPSRAGTVILNSLLPVLANDSAAVSVRVYTGQTAEGCVTATAPRASVLLSHAGRNASIRRAVRGFAVQCELNQIGGSHPWALESMSVGFDPSGLPVRHARVAGEGATGGS